MNGRIQTTLLDAATLNTKRSKRWNGNLDSLTPDFLKDVIERMDAYGDQVQFELPGKGQRPNYQVMNAAGKKMAFDSKNLLLGLNSNGNVGDHLSSVFTLGAIKAALNGGGVKTIKGRVSRGPSTGGARVSATAQVLDTIERDKYAYFKSNRETLPAGIEKYSGKISDLMRSGLSAEGAFDAVVEQLE